MLWTSQRVGQVFFDATPFGPTQESFKSPLERKIVGPSQSIEALENPLPYDSQRRWKKRANDSMDIVCLL